MSLLGKVLAILNLLTLIGAGFLGAMVYAQRQNWTHTIFLANLYLDGLPVDAYEMDKSGSPVAPRIGPATLTAMFGTADVPSTQEGVVKAMAKDQPDVISSDCALAGHHIAQGLREAGTPAPALQHPLSLVRQAYGLS